MSHSLEPLMQHHKRLDGLFQEHQEALVGLEIERARAALAVFERSLLEHMAFEESQILPIYSKLPRIRGGGVELFTGEHEKLRSLLREIGAIVGPLHVDLVDLRARIITAFDRSALFKGLLEHHDLREGQLLYPRLAELLGADDARALVEASPTPPAPSARLS